MSDPVDFAEDLAVQSVRARHAVRRAYRKASGNHTDPPCAACEAIAPLEAADHLLYIAAIQAIGLEPIEQALLGCEADKTIRQLRSGEDDAP